MFKRNRFEDLLDPRPNKIFKMEHSQYVENLLETEITPSNRILLEELK